MKMMKIVLLVYLEERGQGIMEVLIGGGEVYSFDNGSRPNNHCDLGVVYVHWYASVIYN